MKTFISLKQTHPPKWSTWPPSKETLSKLARVIFMRTLSVVARIFLYLRNFCACGFFFVYSIIIIGRVSFIVAPCGT